MERDKSKIEKKGSQSSVEIVIFRNWEEKEGRENSGSLVECLTDGRQLNV